MTNIDYGRKFDLEELAGALLEAKTSSEKEYFERIIDRILNESDAIRYLREELIKAARVGDRRAVHKINLRIQQVRLNETNGYSWGNNRGNKNVN